MVSTTTKERRAARATAKKNNVANLKDAAQKYKLYSLIDLCSILGLSHTTLYNFARTGKIKARKIGREWKVTEKALNEFVNQSDEHDGDK